MTRPRAYPSKRLAFGACLALLAAAIAAAGLFGQLLGAPTLSKFATALPTIKFNAAVAILAACAGWFALQRRSAPVRALGYALAAFSGLIAALTLAQHLMGLDLGIDAIVSRDRGSLWSGHPGRSSLAICVAMLLTAGAVALTPYRSARTEDLRQLLRLTGLAIPLFAIALHLYDPATLGVIDGFDQTAVSAALALSLLLVAMGFDRPAASLRWQVANIGVVVLAPLVALTVHFASAERDAALLNASARLASLARLGGERQEAVVAQTRQMLTFLARSPTVRQTGPACVRELSEYMPMIPGVRSLYSVDRSGVIRCSHDAAAMSLNVGDRDYVRQAFAENRFTVSGFILAKISGAPRIALAMPTAHESGEPTMLMVAMLDISALASPLEDLAGDLPSGETLQLLDRNGVAIASQPKDVVQVGANLADATFATQALANPGQPFQASDLRGQPTVYYALRVLDGQGTLVVGAPRRDVVRPVDARLNSRLLLIVSILLGSLALGVLGTEIMVLAPIRRLIDYAGRLQGGDLAARPDVRAGGEVGALGRALAAMATAIEDRERRLGGAEALFRGLFDHSPDAKVVIGVSGGGEFRVETWNAAATAVTGLAASDVIGRSPREVFPGSRGVTIERDLRRTLENGAVTTMEREPQTHGFATVFEIVQVPLRGADGEIERIFLSARDISERKRVERLKSEFVSTVSHELRTPLTSIAGSLGLLAGGAAGPLGERARHLIQIAHSNSLRLVRLINDILDIEKIQAGRMTFELRSVSVVDLVGQAIGGLKSYADEYEVEVELAPGGAGLMVYGDQDRLMQVVTNLLSNAVKFSPRQGVVTVAVTAFGEAVSITVKDRGPGIPESFRSRLFSKFAQADGSDSRRKGGTGLGLAICREIVERHAGAISYRTAIGEGTEFEVQLPRHIIRDRGAPPAFAELPPKAKVLICEDDALIAAILAEQMRDAGYEAVTAGTVRSALQIVAAEEIVAVLVDLNLPDGDGIGLIRDLRATAKGKDIPVVVVSADADRMKGEPRAAGLDIAAWMRKPVDTGRLAKLLLQRVSPQPSRPRILHVEDDADLCNVVAAALAPFAEVVCVASVAAARREVLSGGYEIAILDVALEDGSGLELLTDFETAEPRPLPAIIFSARDADRAVSQRAEAALTKSRTSLASLVDVVRDLLAGRDVDRGSVGRGDRRSAG